MTIPVSALPGKGARASWLLANEICSGANKPVRWKWNTEIGFGDKAPALNLRLKDRELRCWQRAGDQNQE